MNLTEELERCIGSGPARPTPQQRVVAGRAALRRRRVTVMSAAAALVVVLPVALGVGGRLIAVPS